MIAALQAFRGIRFLTAVIIVAEAGDLRRFATARQFMAYVGVVPSEYSSGAAQHRGRITKTGNAHLRHVLGEAAHHARYAPAVKGAVKQRQEGVPKDIVDLSWRAQQRLHLRYRHLSGRIGRNKAITAVAREFAGVYVGTRPDDGGTGSMILGVVAQVAVEVGRVPMNPRRPLCDRELALLVRGSLVTAHCPAATALLTREYQSDYRRCFPALGCVLRHTLPTG